MFLLLPSSHLLRLLLLLSIHLRLLMFLLLPSSHLLRLLLLRLLLLLSIHLRLLMFLLLPMLIRLLLILHLPLLLFSRMREKPRVPRAARKRREPCSTYETIERRPCSKPGKRKWAGKAKRQQPKPNKLIELWVVWRPAVCWI